MADSESARSPSNNNNNNIEKQERIIENTSKGITIKNYNERCSVTSLILDEDNYENLPNAEQQIPSTSSVAFIPTTSSRTIATAQHTSNSNELSTQQRSSRLLSKQQITRMTKFISEMRIADQQEDNDTERAIFDFLDEEGIYITDPRQKQFDFYQRSKDTFISAYISSSANSNATILPGDYHYDYGTNAITTTTKQTTSQAIPSCSSASKQIPCESQSFCTDNLEKTAFKVTDATRLLPQFLPVMQELQTSPMKVQKRKTSLAVRIEKLSKPNRSIGLSLAQLALGLESNSEQSNEVAVVAECTDGNSDSNNSSCFPGGFDNSNRNSSNHSSSSCNNNNSCSHSNMQESSCKDIADSVEQFPSSLSSNQTLRLYKSDSKQYYHHQHQSEKCILDLNFTSQAKISASQSTRVISEIELHMSTANTLTGGGSSLHLESSSLLRKRKLTGVQQAPQSLSQINDEF